jgi:hypothetical protein
MRLDRIAATSGCSVAACWCTRAVVLSIVTAQSSTPAASVWGSNRVRIVSHVPVAVRRECRRHSAYHGPVAFWHTTPRAACPESLDDAVQQRPMITKRPAALAPRARRQRLDPRRLLIGQVTITRHDRSIPQIDQAA